MLAISIFSLGLTSFYSIRFSLSTIWGPTLISPWTRLKEEKNIIVPILLLSSISITCGSLISWFPPISSSFFIVPTYLKFIPLTIVIIGVGVAFYITTLNTKISSNLIEWALTHYSLCSIWFLVPLSTQIILKWPIYVAHLNIKYIDQGWVENISGLKANRKLINLRNYIYNIGPKNPSSYLITFSIIIILSVIILF